MLSLEMLASFPGVTSDQVTWVTVSAWSVSMLTAPFIVHICRDHSVRLIAVIGTHSYTHDTHFITIARSTC